MGVGITFSSDSGTLVVFGATVWVSCVNGLSVPVSLWLLVDLSRTSHEGSYLCLQGLPTLLGGSGPTLFQVELVTYEVEDLLGV